MCCCLSFSGDTFYIPPHYTLPSRKMVSIYSPFWIILVLVSIDWFKGKITGDSHISWENLWFPVDFPLSQAIDTRNFDPEIGSGNIDEHRHLLLARPQEDPILEAWHCLSTTFDAKKNHRSPAQCLFRSWLVVWK